MFKTTVTLFTIVALFSLISSQEMQLQKAIQGYQVTFGETPGLGFFEIDIISDHNEQLNFYGVYDHEDIKIITNDIFKTPRELFEYVKDFINEQNILDIQRLITEKHVKINIHPKIGTKQEVIEAIFKVIPSELNLEQKLIDRVKRIQHLRNHEQGDSSAQDETTFGVLEEDQGTYEGQIKNGMKHGQGTLQYKQNDIEMRVSYSGLWNNGLKQGQGKMIWRTKASYDGQWKQDKQQGSGIMIYCNRFRYQGQWKNGMRQGQGKIYSPCGQLRLEGTFKNNLLNGYGVSICPNGKRVQGNWVMGIIQGPGKLYFPDGNILQVTYKNGIAVESAEMKYPDGSSEKIPLINGLFSGKSEYIAVDGAKSTREWANDKLKN